MRQRRKTEVPTPTGPALKAEQVCELWVWIWSAIESCTTDEQGPERDEAQRLVVAFTRALENRGAFEMPSDQIIRDQGPVTSALLAHYLLTRADQWTARMAGDLAASRRLKVVTDAAKLLGTMLGVDVHALAESFERLGVGAAKRSLFSPEVREGVTLESLEEGPALPIERKEREAQAHANWDATWRELQAWPKKRRQLKEVSP